MRSTSSRTAATTAASSPAAAPAEGELIYARLDAMTDFEAVAGYALGSLDHFAELLSVYAGAR